MLHSDRRNMIDSKTYRSSNDNMKTIFVFR